MPAMIPSQRETVYKTLLRSCPGPTAVVLHQIQTGVEMLTNQLAYCKRPLPTAPQRCHQSFHYALGNCQFVQFVPDADTAWGFYYIPTPLCPEPPCPIIQTCDGLGADQYNPDFDGNAPTPTVAAGTDLTANCSVIHFAVSMGSGTYLCPPPNTKAYDCLVRALCYVFDVNGLTPVSGSTLLTHIGELVDLDLDQLAIDIAACLSEPPPTLVECSCLPQVSDAVGNAVELNADGIFVPISGGFNTPITVVDSSTINLTASGLDSHTLTAVAIVSPDAGNTTEIRANGLYTPGSDLELNGCGGAITEEDTIVTAEAFADNDPITTPARIWASPTEGNCPAPLIGIEAGPEVPFTTVVLGVGAGPDFTPQWSVLERSALSVGTFSEVDTVISPDDADVMRYVGDGAHNVSLDVGTTKTDMWIKNSSAAVLTITPASGTIDGVASVTLQGTIPLGYPYGNNGGESIHVVSNGTNWFIL